MRSGETARLGEIRETSELFRSICFWGHSEVCPWKLWNFESHFHLQVSCQEPHQQGENLPAWPKICEDTSSTWIMVQVIHLLDCFFPKAHPRPHIALPAPPAPPATEQNSIVRSLCAWFLKCPPKPPEQWQPGEIINVTVSEIVEAVASGRWFQVFKLFLQPYVMCFSPTCQVRVVRFYQSSSPSFFLPPSSFLLLATTTASARAPDHSGQYTSTASARSQ